MAIADRSVTARSASAERMRRHRERRRKGCRSVTIEIHDLDIDGLVRRGLLQVELRPQKDRVVDALYDIFDQVLVDGA